MPIRLALAALVLLASCRDNRPAAQVFWGTYQTSGTFTVGDTEVPADAGCGVLRSPSPIAGEVAVAPGATENSAVITDVTSLCSFVAVVASVGVFEATNAVCNLPPASSLLLVGYSGRTYQSFRMDVPAGTLRADTVTYWTDVQRGPLKQCASIELQLGPRLASK